MDTETATKISSGLKRANLKAVIVPTKRGDTLVFQGGRYGSHSLSVGASSPERVREHWKGYCESSLEPPTGGMGRWAAKRMVEAFGSRRVVHIPLEWANDARVSIQLRVVDPSKGQGACIELRRVRYARGYKGMLGEKLEDVSVEQVRYYGRKPAGVAQDIEDAMARAGANSLRVGGNYSYVAAAHYIVKIERLTPHRALIDGRYRHGGELRRWVRRSELS